VLQRSGEPGGVGEGVMHTSRRLLPRLNTAVGVGTIEEEEEEEAFSKDTAPLGLSGLTFSSHTCASNESLRE
jgi:hypothetical protein